MLRLHYHLRGTHAIAALLLATLILGAPNHALAQDDAAPKKKMKNREYVLIGYNFSIHSDIRGKIVPFEGLFPQPPRSYKGTDAVYFRLKGIFFDAIKQALEREHGMFIMPLQTYGRRFTYDNEGYPSVPIERAQRKVNAKYFLHLDVEILTSPESSALVSGEKYRDSILAPRDYLRPKINITATIYPRLGIIRRKAYSASVQWMTPIRMEPTMLDGIVNGKRAHDRTTLLEAIDLAVSALMEEI